MKTILQFLVEQLKQIHFAFSSFVSKMKWVVTCAPFWVTLNDNYRNNPETYVGTRKTTLNSICGDEQLHYRFPFSRYLVASSHFLSLSGAHQLSLKREKCQHENNLVWTIGSQRTVPKRRQSETTGKSNWQPATSIPILYPLYFDQFIFPGDWKSEYINR